jgi:hypothetical protein
MSLEVIPVAEDDLPFRPGGTAPTGRINIFSEPDADAIADGETEPFGWMDLCDMIDGFDRLIDAEERVLEAPVATLVLAYPLGTAAVRVLNPEDGRTFTRGELMRRIHETYVRIYEMEAVSQSAPTPTMEERRQAFDDSPKVTEKDVEAMLGEFTAAMQEAEAEGVDPNDVDLSKLVPKEMKGAVTLNRPESDGTFGIWGHDIEDLGVSSIGIHQINGKIWLDPIMES